MGDLSPNFSRAEFACVDCGECPVSIKLVDALQKVRDMGPERILVHDGYRCPKHNRTVGGVGHSQHVLGLAVDFHIEGLSLQAQYDRVHKVPEFAAGGIGVYDSGFVHADLRGLQGGKAARWSRIDGKYRAIDELIST